MQRPEQQTFVVSVRPSCLTFGGMHVWEEEFGFSVLTDLEANFQHKESNEHQPSRCFFTTMRWEIKEAHESRQKIHNSKIASPSRGASMQMSGAQIQAVENGALLPVEFQRWPQPRQPRHLLQPFRRRVRTSPSLVFASKVAFRT